MPLDIWFFVAKIMGAAVAPIRNTLYWISQLVPGFKKLTQLSLAMQIAILTFVFLLIVNGSLTYWYSIQEERLSQAWRILGWGTYILVPLLTLAIPVMVYYLVRLLMQKSVSDYPDIDQAWEAGMTAIREAGIDLKETPLYLVIGSPDQATANNLISASRQQMTIKSTPRGPAALHWYASHEAIFVFCSDACCTSRLGFRAHHPLDGPAAPVVNRGTDEPVGHTGTIQVGSGGGNNPGKGRGHDPTQTMVSGGSISESPQMMGSAAPVAHAATQTLVAGSSEALFSSRPGGSGSAPGAATGRIELSAAELNQCTNRLAYLLELVAKSRQPICPANGILVVASFDLLNRANVALQGAIQRDLNTIRDGLLMRCAVTILVSEMESEPGFMELVRRVGPQAAGEQRFGKGFNVWADPTDANLAAVGRHACGSFEDWTYMLFREKGALAKPGNTKLFSLLCKIRGNFMESLVNLLSDSVGYNVERNPECVDQNLLFNGCYFAATGASEDRQAFVKSAFLKMMQQDSEVSWLDQALNRDDRYQALANVFAFVGVLCGLALLYIVLCDFGVIKGALNLFD